MTARSVDVAIVGAGMAGASLAAALADAADLDVLLLEAEDAAGYHSTGRSAAAYIPSYGAEVPALRALTLGSRAFLDAPPAGFTQTPLLRARPVLWIGDATQQATLAARHEALAGVCPDLKRLSPAEVAELVPALDASLRDGALLEPDVHDMEVAALHQGALARHRSAGGELVLNARIEGVEHREDGWHLRHAGGEVRARILVNAAGAWADQLAALAGLAPLGLVPKRRTAILVDPPTTDPGFDAWPFVVDVDERFYCRPDAGALLVSPADATPSEPCDAAPEEFDVAIAADHVERAFGAAVRRVRHRWAGLRTFAPDGAPIIGFDPRARGFFWLAGQGGYGIQTAPAQGRAAAALLLGDDLPGDLLTLGLLASDIAPDRLLAS